MAENQQNMRTNKALKNVCYAFLSYSSLFLLSLILRKVFLKYLDADFLGVEGVLGNLFSLMALVDVGTGALITYLLYKAFSEDNKEEVSILMGMYRNMYLLIAGVMAVLGVFLIPLLPYIISSENIEWKFVVWIYVIKMLGMLGSYCYSYRRLLFKVDQCEYICTRVDMVTSYLRYIAWFGVLFAWQSYLLYLCVDVLAIWGANIYIARLSNKRYPYATGKNVGLEEYRKRNFFHDMKNTYILRIAGTIFGSVANLIISSFLGLRYVALLANYLLITQTLSQGFAKLLYPLQGSIGNYLYKEDVQKSIQLFKMFDLFAFLVGSTLACCFMTVINNFIIIWLGEEYLFSRFTVFFITLSLYVGFCSHFTSCFRDVFGRFELERNYAIGAAVINLSVSLVLVNLWGIAGVYLGTIIGLCGFWVGRYRVLRTELFKQPIGYLRIQIKYGLIFVTMVFISLFICQYIENTLLGLIAKIMVSLFVSTSINFIIFYRSPEFSMIKGYFGQSLKLLFEKIR